jgi:hypothetical protein
MDIVCYHDRLNISDTNLRDEKAFIKTDRQRERQTETQTDKTTDGKDGCFSTIRQIKNEAERWADMQTDRQTYVRIDRRMDRQTDSPTDRDNEPVRRKDGQTCGQTHVRRVD